MKEGYWSKKVDVQRAKVQSSELSINLISQDYGISETHLFQLQKCIDQLLHELCGELKQLRKKETWS